MRIVLTPDRDTDNTYPHEVNISADDDVIMIRMFKPEREIWLNRKDFLMALLMALRILTEK
jgi:hypothetical protein